VFLLVVSNWLIFVWAVVNGNVLSPVSAISSLRWCNFCSVWCDERMSRTKRLGVLIAARHPLPRLVLGTPPWISLSLAITFGLTRGPETAGRRADDRLAVGNAADGFALAYIAWAAGGGLYFGRRTTGRLLAWPG
jgi:hypothetical protein